MKAITAVLLCVLYLGILPGLPTQALRPAYDLGYFGESLSLPDGGVLITWRSTIAGDADIYAQRLGNDGLPVWDAPVAVVSKPGAQYYKSMFVTSEGNYLITWNDSPRVWAQLLSPQGQKLWQNEGIVLNEQALCWLTPNQNGGLYIITYSENPANNLYQLKGKSIGSTSNQLWTPTEKILVSSDVPLYCNNLLTEANGFMLNVTKEFANAPHQSYLLRFDSQGNQVGNEPLLAPEDFPKSVFKIQSLPDSSYLLWHNTNTVPDTLTMQKMDSQGNLLLPTPRVLLLPSSAGYMDIPNTRPLFTPLDNGGILLAWSYDVAIMQYQYRMQRLDSALQPLWDVNGVNVTPALYNYNFRFVIDASQQVYCVWKEYVRDYNSRIKAQKLSPTGEFLWSAEGVMVDNSSLYANFPVAWHGGGQYHCLWYAEQDSQNQLNRQTLNNAGSLVLPPGGETFYSQIGGYSSKPLSQSLNGNFLTFWQDVRPDNEGIYYQVCDAQMNSLLPPSGKKLLPNTSDRQVLLQVEQSDGKVAILYYLYGSNYTYYVQMVDAQGEILLPDLGYYIGQNIFNVVMDFVDGDVYIAWSQIPVEQYPGYIKAQKFVNGTPVWASGGTLIYNTTNIVQNLTLNNRYFSWHEYQGPDRQAYAKRVDENGYTISSWGNNPLQIIDSGEGSYYCSATGLDGDELIVYVRKEVGAEVKLYAQKISPVGDRLWGAQGVLLDSNTGNIWVGGSLYGNGSAVCYQTTMPSVEVHLQKLDATGNKLFGDSGASFAQAGAWSSEPLLYQNENGWYSLVMCLDSGMGTDYDLYYRMVSPQGVPSAFGTQVFCSERLNQRHPSLCGAGNSAFVSWVDMRSGLINTNSTGTAIYAGLLVSDGSPVVDEVVPQALLGRVLGYPNPFKLETAISFILQTKGMVTIDIYNLRGQKLHTLGNGTTLDSGENQLFWNGRDASGRLQPAGVYLYRLNCGNTIRTGKLVKL